MATNNNGKTTAAALLEERDKTEQAVTRIDKDPEEALRALERSGALKVAPNVDEITPHDMFQMMRDMQAQMARMQEQMITVMTGQTNGGRPQHGNANLAEELNRDKIQREGTLELWRTEPREPVYLQPDGDEEKVFQVTGAYPPRVFRINGLEFPIMVGEVVNVPGSVAVVVKGTQRVRPMQKPPQTLQQINDPQHTQFLAGSQSISAGQAGKSGEGRLAVSPGAHSLAEAQPLDVRYDHNGQ